ncbi:hypothetical protein JHK82_034889 [Glycine max]|uniref:Uncharacterized protein n=2 Tax=Glycine subgen. Soja TaxID=1462606 RepID=A0A0R0GS45_SOYBN|nr:hypothetical protein JHK87_034925 [Glycine soja]KAG4969176.1 hypothetical protein JHK85_035597 [Glycine max]KAG4975608.1 hypothetical protein JHK86_035082 [Glycine max]KAG5111620.1 hypothetical protein JHK82_034889 [Glycine max]KAG5128987.1 hypothetical protein JHK84_035384 [Glycine max]
MCLQGMLFYRKDKKKGWLVLDFWLERHLGKQKMAFRHSHKVMSDIRFSVKQR